MCNRSLPIFLALAAISAASGFAAAFLGWGLPGYLLLVSGTLIAIVLLGVRASIRRHEAWLRLRCPTCASAYSSNTPFLVGAAKERTLSCAACGTTATFLQDAKGSPIGHDPVPSSIRPYTGLEKSSAQAGTGAP